MDAPFRGHCPVAPSELIRMTESGTLGQRFYRQVVLALCVMGFCFPAALPAQENPIPLGDVARAARKKKEQPQAQQEPQPAPAPKLIDNDNLTQVMDEAESRHLTSTSFLYSFDGAGKTFQVSSPDVMCSLSFNGHSSSLLSHPFIQTDLPEEEVRKLNGPATIGEEGLQVSVYNGTQWRVEEITVGLTIVHRDDPIAGYHGSAKLIPAAAETPLTVQKQPDVTTTLYHLKAVALPSATVIFKSLLSPVPAPDQEWHWTIVQARGIPPRPEDSALKTPITPSNNAVIP